MTKRCTLCVRSSAAHALLLMLSALVLRSAVAQDNWQQSPQDWQQPSPDWQQPAPSPSPPPCNDLDCAEKSEGYPTAVSPCQGLDCVDKPAPYTDSSPSPPLYVEPVPSPDPSPVPSPEPAPSPSPEPVPSPIAYQPEAAFIPSQQPAPLCSDTPVSNETNNRLVRWCEMDVAYLWFKPLQSKPRFFPGTLFIEGFGSPHMNETQLKVEWYPAEKHYVITATYDSGDDQPFSYVQVDFTTGIVKIMPFSKPKGEPAVNLIWYHLPQALPSVQAALSTRTGFMSTFKPLSEALDFVEWCCTRFQTPYIPAPEIAMPMQRNAFVPELVSVVQYLQEIRASAKV